jgi:2-amino-4-hydroxy-6-hydroxymethyldihydropteridine diphosphokinase
MSNQVYLLIGGNLGNRMKLLKEARIGIEKQIGKILKESSIYETAAWGFESENDFLNQVLVVETELNPLQVLEECQRIENQLGRVRASNHYASRTMDIDILFYNDEIIQNERLTIPHPKLHLRRFTLEPLAEVSPEYIHPVLKMSIKKILDESTDATEVKKI